MGFQKRITPNNGMFLYTEVRFSTLFSNSWLIITPCELRIAGRKVGGNLDNTSFTHVVMLLSGTNYHVMCYQLLSAGIGQQRRRPSCISLFFTFSRLQIPTSAERRNTPKVLKCSSKQQKNGLVYSWLVSAISVSHFPSWKLVAGVFNALWQHPVLLAQFGS